MKLISHLVLLVAAQFLRQCPANGDANHHSDPRLLGDQDVQDPLALVRVLDRERLGELAGV